jgi:hypothetical protein
MGGGIMTVIINGSTGIDTVQDGIVTDAKLNLTANSQEIKDSLNASGSAPIYACRAWVNFNGTGTVAIRSSGNVSSISDNGTGSYTVNLTTALPDTDACPVLGMAQSTTATGSSSTYRQVVYVSSTTAIVVRVGATSATDCEFINIAVFR